MNPQDLPAVLQWLSGPGSAIVVAYVLSLVVENVPAWAKVPRALKVIIPMLVSILLSIGSTLLLRNTALVLTIGPIWAMVVGAILSYLATQQAFISVKRSGYGIRAGGYKK